MATFDYNPITGNLDLVGSGASYIDGEVEYHSNLPVTVGTPAVNSAFLVRKGEGLYFISRKPAGIWVRELNNGNLDDWKYAGTFSDIYRDANFRIISDADTSKQIAFSASSIGTGQTRTITVPNKNVTLDDAGDSRTPTAHAASHGPSGSDPLAHAFRVAVSSGSFSGTLLYTGESNGKPSWGESGQDQVALSWNGSKWRLFPSVAGGFTYYESTDANIFTATWSIVNGVSPAPTLTFDFIRLGDFSAPVHTHSYTAITDLGDWANDNLADVAVSGSYNDLLDAPALGTAAAEDSTAFAAASHSHGNLTSDGKLGSIAGLPVVTTTAGAVTTLALGTANQVLRVNSGASGVEFADPAASGVTGAASSASDVLGVSGANITGVDANADRIVYWNNTSNKLAYGTPADAGAAAASHTHAASDVTSGTFDNARINFAAPAAIGNTTPNTGAFTSLSTAPAANTAAFTTTGYSLTGSNAQSLVDLAGTWNTTGTPSAFKLNITDTASNASSLLMQLQTGGTNRFTVSKGGLITTSDRIRVGDGSDAAPSYSFVNGTTSGFRLDSGVPRLMGYLNNSTIFVITSSAIAMQSTHAFAWTNGGAGSTTDTLLWRDAAGTLAQYNGTNAQEKRLYGTYTSATNYQRMTIKSVKQTLSALSGASATTTGTFIPDGAVVVGVTTRVATALTGAAGYTIGDGTDADRWGDITGTAIGTTSDNRDWTAGTIECFTAGGEITLTAKTSNFTAGAIEICVFYLAGQAD